jgi:hypothetical protein
MNTSALACFPLLALVIAGCARPEGDALTIACPWPAGERAAIASDYRKAHPSDPPIAWIPLIPGDDAARLVPRLGVDLVLGLPAADLDTLDSRGQLIKLSESDDRPWRIARRLTLGLDVRASPEHPVAGPSLADRGLASRVALDDPRLDPMTLAWAKARLAAGGYGELVRTAANALRARRAGTGPDRVRRGEALVAPDAGVVGPIDERTSLNRLEGAQPWIEGVAVLRGARREVEALAFLGFLAGRGQAEPVPDDIPRADPVADGLLADLLGAALVDAQDELWAATDALDRAGHPAPYEGFLDDPPPWPPTSVKKLREQPEADELLAALSREISPDPDARAWLLRTWEGPPRPIDAAWLRDAASAADGRLAAEPRFRSWLRAEWTAWARQHYRRIAREATRKDRVGWAPPTVFGDHPGRWAEPTLPESILGTRE